MIQSGEAHRIFLSIIYFFLFIFLFFIYFFNKKSPFFVLCFFVGFFPSFCIILKKKFTNSRQNFFFFAGSVPLFCSLRLQTGVKRRWQWGEAGGS